MAIQVTVKEATVSPAIPEAVYRAALVFVDEGTGQYGEYLKLTFEIVDGEHKGVVKTLVCSKKLTKSKSGKSSKLFDVVKALTKSDPGSGASIDLEDLIGKACQIVIKNGKQIDGVQYQDVSAVLSV
jgi:hypothetical protein